jgi:uncharacterized repeat protein (TIGR04138 family)
MDDLQRLHDITQKDKRYALEAYLFVLEAIQYTRTKYKREKHVSGHELLEGIKDLALRRFGAMTIAVFEHWGIHETIDVGHIVFNMVNDKILHKTEEDRLEDFKDYFDFEKVFVQDYRFNFRDDTDQA